MYPPLNPDPWTDMETFQLGNSTQAGGVWMANRIWTTPSLTMPLMVDVSQATKIRFQIQTYFDTNREKVFIDQVMLEGLVT